MIEATINGYQFRPERMEIEYKVRAEGDLPYKLIIFSEQKDLIVDFCKDGDPVEIQWKIHNESATSTQNKVRCHFESSRLTSEVGIKLMRDHNKNLLESVWRIFRWECSAA